VPQTQRTGREEINAFRTIVPSLLIHRFARKLVLKFQDSGFYISNYFSSHWRNTRLGRYSHHQVLRKTAVANVFKSQVEITALQRKKKNF
jgi:hypothetical protein